MQVFDIDSINEANEPLDFETMGEVEFNMAELLQFTDLTIILPILNKLRKKPIVSSRGEQSRIKICAYNCDKDSYFYRLLVAVQTFRSKQQIRMRISVQEDGSKSWRPLYITEMYPPSRMVSFNPICISENKFGRLEETQVRLEVLEFNVLKISERVLVDVHILLSELLGQ